MKTSPLQLNRHFLLNVQLQYGFQERPGDNLEQDQQVQPTATYDVNADPVFHQSEDEPKSWHVELTVRFHPTAGEGTLGYRGEVVFAGIFTIAGMENDEPMTLRILAANAPALLYSAARELVLTLTSRGPGSPVVLPTVNFTDIDLDREPVDDPDARRG
jgi:preprotein translocase subunit SecB